MDIRLFFRSSVCFNLSQCLAKQDYVIVHTAVVWLK